MSAAGDRNVSPEEGVVVPDGASHRFHARSDAGRERPGNEDAFRVERLEDGAILMVVCDGMGGHEAGEVASELAATSLIESLKESTETPPAAIRTALEIANRVVLEATTKATRNMGTTAVIAKIVGNVCWYGWVGDSRLYHIRDGSRLGGSRDHTRVQQLVDLGVLTPAQAHHHPESHILMQALGGGPSAQEAFQPSVPIEPILLEPGDCVLLCSDGLYDMLDDEEICEFMAGLPVEDSVRRLIDAANVAGGADNVTVALLVANAEAVPPLSAEARARISSTEKLRVSQPPLPREANVSARWIGLGVGLGIFAACVFAMLSLLLR